ncbi:MAG TPA: hypothetical protein VK544_02650 [Gemmatimonadaceae bacterium]|nr:hypothetical protein [Gemmatimonadaceae bacterium]
MSFLPEIFDRFRPIATIQAEAGELVFQCGTNEARAQPMTRYADDGKIFAFGETAATAKVGRLIRLFPTETPSDHEAIRMFCRYHMAVISTANLLKPRVTIVERTIRKNFGSQATSALERALRAEGFQVDIGAG